MRRSHLWLPVLFAHSAVLAILYPDSYQQDGGYHFLCARFAYRYPDYLIGTWSRPLFTALYSIPAQLGYLPAKLLTAAVLCGTGWFTWKLAETMRLARAWLVYPLLLVQPVVQLLSFDTMTEPLFALLLAAALYYHRIGRPWIAALLISLLPMVRAEGFFLGFFWGVVMLADPRIDVRFWLRWPKTSILLTGTLLWWGEAWAISGDPLYLARTWVYRGGHEYGYPSLPWYGGVGFESAGPLVFVLVLIGLGRGWLRGHRMLSLLFVYFFLLQAAVWEFGIAGGYARHFVCISPVAAVLALLGLESTGRPTWPRVWATALGVGLAWSWTYGVRYVDSQRYLRDAPAVREAYRWYRSSEHPTPKRLAWSQAYMAILFDLDAGNPLPPFQSRESGLKKLREFGSGTLIFWDANTGPAWFRLDPRDFEAAGFRRIYGKKHRLQGYKGRLGLAPDFTHDQEISLYLKE